MGQVGVEDCVHLQSLPGRDGCVDLDRQNYAVTPPEAKGSPMIGGSAAI
jgi:hypothetical protein